MVTGCSAAAPAAVPGAAPRPLPQLYWLQFLREWHENRSGRHRSAPDTPPRASKSASIGGCPSALRCLESSNFCATSFRSRARVVSGVTILATSASACLPNCLCEVSHWCDQCDMPSFEHSGSRGLLKWLDEPTRGELHVTNLSEPGAFPVGLQVSRGVRA
jgi:hypothetical protein